MISRHDLCGHSCQSLSNQTEQAICDPCHCLWAGVYIGHDQNLEIVEEILRRVDEAKQWAIGDWLVDGKRHYGDGLYKKAAGILGIQSNKLEQYATIARRFKDLRQRKFSLTYTHHYEVVSLKTIADELDKDDKPTGKLYLSDETDYKKITVEMGVWRLALLWVREGLLGVSSSKLSGKDCRSVIDNSGYLTTFHLQKSESA